jgi:hypothetical protein
MAARCVIGAMVTNVHGQPIPSPIVTRSGAQPIFNEETALVAHGAPAGWHYGASRCHYMFMDQGWTSSSPPTRQAISGSSTADFENDRLPVVSTKISGSTWAQVAAGNADSIINTRGAEIAQWQDDHRGLGKWGATFVWSYHHEPNGQNEIDAGNGSNLATLASNWRAATQHVYDLWVAQGVTIWDGESDWTTNTEGLILAINLVDGAASNASLNAPGKGVFWGPANGAGAGDTWMDQHMVMFTTDPYPLTVMRPLSELVTTSVSGFPSIRTWSNAKKTYQESQGRPFLQGIFETGTRQVAQYTGGVSSQWTATGLAATEANWIINMRNYIRDTWTDLNLLCYWDDNATGWYEIDRTLAAFNAAATTFSDPAAYNDALAPIPGGFIPPTTASAGVGAILG